MNPRPNMSYIVIRLNGKARAFSWRRFRLAPWVRQSILYCPRTVVGRGIFRTHVFQLARNRRAAITSAATAIGRNDCNGAQGVEQRCSKVAYAAW